MSDFNPDAFIASQEGSGSVPAPAAQQTAATSESQTGFDPDSFIQDAQQEKYGGAGQQAIAGLEGVARGVAGPLAPLAERMLGADPEAMRGRQEANPITAGVGEAAGLTGGLLTGTGEAAVMGKAGELAAGAVGLSQVAQDASLGYKVGSAAVKGAAEMAVLQTGDEASKMIMQDPDASAQTALSNIGMAAAFGGAGGAFFTGAVNPLWEAVGGPKVTEMLSGMVNHANGTPLALPAEREAALKTLGITADPVMHAGMSGDPKAMEYFNHLRESQSPEILDGINNLKRDASNSVMQSLGIDPAMVAESDAATTGHAVFDKFSEEIENKYEPALKAIEERNANAAPIATSDESRMKLYQQVYEKGMASFGTDSPLFKLYDDWGNRALSKETIGGLDSLKTEIGGEYSKAMRAGDTNTTKALGEIRGMISDFQESQITKQSAQAAADGAEHGVAIGKDIIAQRAAANASYAGVKNTMAELAGHLGVPEFRGLGSTLNKLGEKMSPEDLLRKLSPKNNADIIPFLQQHFPETAEALRQHEASQIARSAVIGAKGGDAIDMTKLQKNIKGLMAGKANYVKWAIPGEALNKISAAETLSNSLPNFKSSGTAGWMMKMVKHVPMSGMAMVGMMTGHNPVMAGIMGEMAEKIGVGAPNAIKLAHLKLMGSTEPVSATGFKSMVEFMHNTIKGESALAKGTAAIFKSGAQVMTSSQMPDKDDRAKLDKVVDKSQTHPEQMLAMQSGHAGHYLPDHQQAMAQTTQRSLQYLQSLKPKPTQNSPLDKPIPPSDAQTARYNRALDIAQSPNIVLHHIQNGTLQPSDVADLKTMYPAIYNRMANGITGHMSGSVANETPIPYHSKVAISMFLGQPMDSTMTPNAIMGAQGVFQQAPPPGSTQAKGKPSAMKDKASNAYKTSTQEAESDRADRS